MSCENTDLPLDEIYTVAIIPPVTACEEGEEVINPYPNMYYLHRLENEQYCRFAATLFMLGY